MSYNTYGVDQDYFKKKLEEIIRDIQNYTPEELSISLSRLSTTAKSNNDEYNKE